MADSKPVPHPTPGGGKVLFQKAVKFQCVIWKDEWSGRDYVDFVILAVDPSEVTPYNPPIAAATSKRTAPNPQQDVDLKEDFFEVCIGKFGTVF